MTDLMESRMIAALLGRKAVTPPEVSLSREEMVAYLLKYANMIPVADRISLLRTVEKIKTTNVSSKTPDGTAIDLGKLDDTAIFKLYEFVRHTREIAA